jgi:hypothetical protein
VYSLPSIFDASAMNSLQLQEYLQQRRNYRKHCETSFDRGRAGFVRQQCETKIEIREWNPARFGIATPMGRQLR